MTSKKSVDTENKIIDIKEIFRDKNPSLVPYIPGFVWRYLRRILHEEFVNYVLSRHGDKKGYDFARATVEEFEIKVNVEGIENLPDEERLVFASNHPLGGFDGMMLISLLSDKYRPLKVLVNDILTNIKNMDGVFVPINKHGRQSSELVRMIEGIFASDAHILTFPAGFVSRRNKGVIRDPAWQKNFITKSVQHKRNLIPIFVSGRCSNRFYNISNIRKFFGLKANIEMFYLPDESYRHRGGEFTIKIGKPISWKIFDNSMRPSDWALKVQDHVYRMGEGYKGEFNA